MQFTGDIMDNYQQFLFELFKDYRPIPNYPVYPPYHQGLYIEDTFIKDFQKNNVSYDRYFIPISWTTVYCDNKDGGLQEKLNQLDSTKKYFIVCQHDDAPKHKIPTDTIVFSASEHVKNTNPMMKPIPAICSPIIGAQEENKIFFAGFVGSYTHNIRIQLQNILGSLQGYYFSGQQWTPNVPNYRVNEFMAVTSQCKFTLCPRGYGNTSFRMYECMQLGSVPVYISDDFHLPWSDEIDWKDFCVMIDSKDIGNTDHILKSISDEQYISMKDKIKTIYNKYFTLENLHNNIIRRIA